MNLDEFLVELRTAVQKMGVTQAAVQRADDIRKVVLAEQSLLAKNGADKVSSIEAEAIARCSQEYHVALVELDVARIKAAEASAEAEYMRARFDAWRSKMAMKRAKITQS